MADSNPYQPPFALTNRLLALTADIAALAALLNIKEENRGALRLRRENRIRTIQSSLAIENNTLSLEQVTAVLQGKRVLAPPKDIAEAQNAFDAYELMPELSPYSLDDLRRAHGQMMKGLIGDAGQFRSGGVGVFSGDGALVHMAPPAEFVYPHMAALLAWLEATDLHPLIAGAIFHYEFEYIHPFADGNGRMGRFWQTLILSKWQPSFAWLPIETLIKDRQQAYYRKISETTSVNDTAVFVEFMLEIIKETLAEIMTDQDTDQDSDYVDRLLQALGDQALSARQIMTRLGLSHLPNFRKVYLQPALNQGKIERTIPDKPKSKNQRYKKR